jgi:hypothetical protein
VKTAQISQLFGAKLHERTIIDTAYTCQAEKDKYLDFFAAEFETSLTEENKKK